MHGQAFRGPLALRGRELATPDSGRAQVRLQGNGAFPALVAAPQISDAEVSVLAQREGEDWERVWTREEENAALQAPHTLEKPPTALPARHPRPRLPS